MLPEHLQDRYYGIFPTPFYVPREATDITEERWVKSVPDLYGSLIIQILRTHRQYVRDMRHLVESKVSTLAHLKDNMSLENFMSYEEAEVIIETAKYVLEQNDQFLLRLANRCVANRRRIAPYWPQPDDSGQTSFEPWLLARMEQFLCELIFFGDFYSHYELLPLLLNNSQRKTDLKAHTNKVSSGDEAAQKEQIVEFFLLFFGQLMARADPSTR